jgi:hypothetical protein
VKCARPSRRPLALAPLLGLLLAAPAAAGDLVFGLESEPVRKGYDLVVLRPLDLVRFVSAAAFFPVAYPVSLVTGGSDFVLEVCIGLPFDRTFRRPLGEL